MVANYWLEHDDSNLLIEIVLIETSPYCLLASPYWVVKLIDKLGLGL